MIEEVCNCRSRSSKCKVRSPSDCYYIGDFWFCWLQIRDITGCATDEIVVALHDCNDDMEKAVTALLERDRNEEEVCMYVS